MLKISLDKVDGIAILEPQGELSAEDFANAAAIIDPYIEANDSLAGILICVEAFPGWDSFGSLVSHLQFVRDHHHEVERIAFATDSPLGGIAEHLGNHFVNAEIRAFTFADTDNAIEWLEED